MAVLLVFLIAVMQTSAQLAQPNSSGVSMGHLHILTPDPAAQKKLWIEVLGGKLVKAGPLEFASFPDVVVGFRSGESDGGTVGSIVDHLGFLTRDLAGTKAKLAPHTKIVSENQETHQIFALFPGDVLVEFTEDTSIDVPIRHHHIHFATPQEDKMRSWYAKLFGAVPGMRGRFKAADLPGVNLSWKTAAKSTLPTKGRALDHIGFEVADIKGMCAKAEGAGAKLETAPRSLPDLGLTVAFLTDPWGTRIELTEGLGKLK